MSRRCTAKGDQDAVAPAKTPDKSLYHLPPKLQKGEDALLERVQEDGDEVTWFVQLTKTHEHTA